MEYKANINELETKLSSAEREAENHMKDAAIARNELSDIRKELESKDGSSNLLSKQLTERDENERILCAEIEQLKTESDVLNRTIGDLEATIVKLDEDITTSDTNINSYKATEEELKKGLVKVTQEREEFESRALEMEQALDEFVRSTESRIRSSGRSSVGKQAYFTFST